MQVVESYEKNLLGTAGTLLTNADFFKGCTGLLIHADNATDTDINQLIKAHRNRPKQCLLTMLTFTTDAPQKCGVVETDPNGIVQCFYEKVQNPPGNRANGAVYVFEEELLSILKALNPQPRDFSTEVMTLLSEGFTLTTHLITSSTLERQRA